MNAMADEIKAWRFAAELVICEKICPPATDRDEDLEAGILHLKASELGIVSGSIVIHGGHLKIGADERKGRV
jgi:hypothetical protein